MKFILRKIFLNSWASKYFLSSLLRLHNKLYDLISMLVLIDGKGIHPKRAIIRYDDWFISKLNPNDIVLDIGCHEGALTSSISQKAKVAYGIELEEHKIIRAKSKYSSKNLLFFHGDATKFNYNELEPISVVTLSNVLEHINERSKFLNSLICTVKWSGKPRFLIRVPTLERDWLSVYKKNRGVEYRLDKTHFIEHTSKEFKDEITSVGLIIESLEIRFGEIYCECSV